MATIAKFTSEVKEYTSPKTNKTKYSRYIVDEANNKGIIESDAKAVLEAIVIGASLPNPSQYQRIQGTTCYWLSGKFTPKQTIPQAVHSVPPPVGVNNVPVHPNHTNVRSGYTLLEMDKLLVHFTQLLIDTLKANGLTFDSTYSTILNTWVMTATQQGVKISGSEEAVVSVAQDTTKVTAVPPPAPTPGIPITLMDARDKAIAQAEKIKASNRSLVIPANASAECEYIIKALDQCAHDEKVTPEFVLIEWSKFEGKNSKTGQKEDKFIKDIEALLKLDAKQPPSKWIGKVYGAAKKWMAENHQEDESQEIPDDAIPEGAEPVNKNYDELPYDDDKMPF